MSSHAPILAVNILFRREKNSALTNAPSTDGHMRAPVNIRGAAPGNSETATEFFRGSPVKKRAIDGVSTTVLSPTTEWLCLESLVEVEITSEHPSHPIESALLAGQASGWRAAEPGRQTIRIIFIHPQPLRQIWLNFHEPVVERTQEYVLRWSPDRGQSFQEIVRQQWNFSPRGSTSEAEDHHVDLQAVTMLELTIIPDLSERHAFASLAQLRLA